MNIYVPFICLAVGTAVNWRGLPTVALKAFDWLMNLALVALMLVIGLNIGVSDGVMENLGKIGVQCIVISFAAICCSVGLVWFCEKTVMPLEKIRLQMMDEQRVSDTAFSEMPEEDGGRNHVSPLIFVMPGCIAIGIVIGFFWMQNRNTAWLDTALTVSLIFLYTGVGVSLASNKQVFGYIRRLGLRIVFMPAAIFAGCLVGGFLAGWLLSMPVSWSVLSASGMGYYSLTGAFLTDSFGIEAGTYGFIVNILRDVLTVSLLPILIKISKGSPIASGAAGCMDTMLVPVSRFVGPELSVVALISGTILTFVVPLWMPFGIALLG
ncbi:lysine exporter LysO family protein [Ihubacter sp. mB4P-1]|uniref:lysine exporter LysO family protein n=1 Tax=Ihubacter sp. mB4P-1 TaxID=3242370 RepID=UPI00137A442C